MDPNSPFYNHLISGAKANSDVNTHTKFTIETNNPEEAESRAVADLIKTLVAEDPKEEGQYSLQNKESTFILNLIILWFLRSHMHCRISQKNIWVCKFYVEWPTLHT